MTSQSGPSTLRAWLLLILLIVAISLLAIFLGRCKSSTAPASELTESLLDFSETIQQDLGLSESATLEEACKAQRHNMKCRMAFGVLYASACQYRKALGYYAMVQEINPRLADPYYTRGNVYYELALIDLIRKGRFTIDSEKLSWTLEPDADSEILFGEVLDEYKRGREYPTLEDPPSPLLIDMVEHRARQINQFFNGSKSIALHPMELLQFVPWVSDIFPEDKELNDEVEKLRANLWDYLIEHPEDFNLPPMARKILEEYSDGTLQETPVAGGSPNNVFEDDFSGPECTWSIQQDEDVEMGCQQNQYRIKVNRAGFTYTAHPSDAEVYTDFELSVNAEQKEGPESSLYGLAFRYQDDKHYYLFVIRGDGYYAVLRADDGWEFLVEWKPSNQISPGRNVLTAAAVGSIIVVRINDEVVDHVVDDAFLEGSIGLAVGTLPDDTVGTLVYFDDVIVAELPQ
jgi:hypothetical protein